MVDKYGILKQYEDMRDEESSKKMSLYMKNNFKFLGINKKKRKKLNNSFFKTIILKEEIDWKFVQECFRREEREFQYLAMDYILFMKETLKADDIYILEKLIVTKPWWDVNDYIAEIVGYILIKYPRVRSRILVWIDDRDIWYKRVALSCQNKLKESTDSELLSRAILHNIYTKEFIVDKAIGVALKEYSKVNKEWVKDFLETHYLSSVSRREAKRYL